MQRYHIHDTVDDGRIIYANRACTKDNCDWAHVYVITDAEYRDIRDHIIGLGRGYIGTSDDNDHYDADIIEQFRR